MDIGSLTGSIALEDQLTDKLKLGIEQIKEFGKRFEGMTGGVLVGAGAITAAITGAVISIVSLGEKGSVILGVEEAFDHLAEAAGTTGDALISGLTQGVRGTIDSMELMQSTTRLLSSGMKLTEADMKLMGATAREMGKATGTNAAQGLNTLSQALLTGNTRSLKRYGINIDLVKSEKAFADSIGTTRDQLSAAGQIEAHRIAMLEGMREKLNRLGESQLSFKERVQQANVAVGDWFDSLAKGVAGSAAVNHAFDTIASGISRAFGGTSQTILQTILSGVDKFANVIAGVAPKIVQAIDTIKNKIIDIWNWLVDFNERWQITNNLIAGARAAWGILQQAFGLVQTAVMAVIDAWRSMPDWLQRITKTALEGALATGIYAAAIKSTAAPIGALISGVDLSINIIGNLTGAVYNVVNLIKPFTAYIANLSLAFANFRVAVLALTASMGINAVITRSLALGHTFLLESLVKTINVIGSFNRALGVTAVVNAAASASAGVLSAAKLFLGRVVLAVSINYNVLLARIGLTTAAMAASSVTAGIATAAMTALGVALTAVQYVLIPVALAWGAWKFGEWLGSFPRVQRAIIWLAEHLHLISTEAANAKRAMLDMNDSFPKGTPAGGYFSIDPAVASIQKTVLELGQRLGKTGDELDQFVDDAVRRFRELKDNGGTDVQILTAQLKSLNVWETDTSVFKKLAEDALRLQASGAVLSPALLDLIARFGDVKGAAQGAGQGVESFTKGVDTSGMKTLAETLSGKAVAEKMKELSGAVKMMGESSKLTETQLYRVAEAAAKLYMEGAALTPELKKIPGVQAEINRQLAAMVPVLAVTTGLTEDFFTMLSKMSPAAAGYIDQIMGNEISRKSQALNEAITQLTASDLLYGESLKRAGIAAAMLAREGGNLTPEMWELALASGKLLDITEGFPDGFNGIGNAVDLVIPKFRQTSDTVAELADGFVALGQIGGQSFGPLMQAIGNLFQNMKTGESVFKRFRQSFIDAGDEVGANSIKNFGIATPLFAKGATAGERWGSAVASAAQIANGAMDAWRQGAAAGSKGAAAFHGAMSGASAGAAFGPWGAAIGAAAGAIVGFVARLSAGRKAIKDFAAEFDTIKPGTGFDELHDQLLRLGSSGEQMWVSLTQGTAKGDKAGAERKIAEIKGALAALDSDIQKYNLTWKDLANKQTAASAAGQVLVDSFKRLTGAGYSAEAVLARMGGDLNQFIIDSVDAGVKIPAAMRPIIESLIRSGKLTAEAAAAMLGLRDTSMPSLADITAAADRYGISLDSLGPKVKQLQITELANQYVADWKVLSAATDDWGVLFEKMGPKVQSLILDAIKYGSELPANMKPMIQAFVDAGQLVDENGEKLTDLTKLTFAADLSEMFETLIGKLDELIEKITSGVGGALDNVGSKVVHPRIEPVVSGGGASEVPPVEEASPMSGGGRVIAFTPRGTDRVPAMLTPGEIVTPAGRSQTPVIIPITLKTRNNEVIAKEVVKTFVAGGL